jgi:hypothetical protein
LAAGVRIFLQKILQSNIVEHGISKEPLQLGVLVFQALQDGWRRAAGEMVSTTPSFRRRFRMLRGDVDVGE